MGTWRGLAIIGRIRRQPVFHKGKNLSSYFYHINIHFSKGYRFTLRPKPPCLFRKRDRLSFFKTNPFSYRNSVKCFWETAITSLPKSRAQQTERKAVQRQQCWTTQGDLRYASDESDLQCGCAEILKMCQSRRKRSLHFKLHTTFHVR